VFPTVGLTEGEVPLLMFESTNCS